MKKIYKYNIPFHTERWRLPLCEDSIVRYVGEQNGQVYIWAEFDDGADFKLEEREFFIVATGQGNDSNSEYVGTVQMESGLVWHVYERVK